MIEELLPKESGPVTLAVNKWIEFFRPRLRGVSAELFKTTQPPVDYMEWVAVGGFEAFLATPEGALAASNIETGALTAALLMYLEDEHRRRSEWEQKIEKRLETLYGHPLDL